MIDSKLFDNAYNICVHQIEKNLSKDFINFIDDLFPEKYFPNPMKKAMITGYFLRCAENLIPEKEMKKPEVFIQNILDSKKQNKQKIKEIADYLDEHDKIGLSQKISSYSLIDLNQVQYFLSEYANDYIKATLKRPEITVKKENLDTLEELTYRNMSYGYLYKLAEEFVKNNKK